MRWEAPLRRTVQLQSQSIQSFSVGRRWQTAMPLPAQGCQARAFSLVRHRTAVQFNAKQINPACDAHAMHMHNAIMVVTTHEIAFGL